jgi:hypothetical protein
MMARMAWTTPHDVGGHGGPAYTTPAAASVSGLSGCGR